MDAFGDGAGDPVEGMFVGFGVLEEFGDGLLEFENELLADGERGDGWLDEAGIVECSGDVL